MRLINSMIFWKKCKARFFGRTCALPETKVKELSGWARSTEADPLQTAFSARRLHFEARKKIAHEGYDTNMIINQKSAHMTKVERINSNAVVANVPKKTSEFVSSTIVSIVKPFAIRVKIMTCYEGKEIAVHGCL
jgi:IS30 family transposase